MKVEKLIYGAVIIVWGIITFIDYWTFGFLGPVVALMGGIPMIISGVFLMLIGLIQGKVDGMGRNEKLLLIIFYLLSLLSFQAVSFFGIFLIVSGMILAPPSKKRMWQLILSVSILLLFIPTYLIIENMFRPIPVPVPP